jgi:hypothetical protein
MFRTWRGDWKAVVKHLVAEPVKAICIIDFTVEHEAMAGITIFELHDGRLQRVTAPAASDQRLRRVAVLPPTP